MNIIQNINNGLKRCFEKSSLTRVILRRKKNTKKNCCEASLILCGKKLVNGEEMLAF